ncbi:MAG: alpha-keto acid decarboxylase family protein, partial [Xenococcaceae cyanobacterium]
DTQLRVYEEVTAYAVTLDNPRTADMQIRQALNYATTFKRPVYLEIPRDMVYAEIDETGENISPVKKTNPEALTEALAETLTMLRNATSPAIVADVEVHRFGMQEQVLQLAEKLCVPVCSTLLGKSVFPESHP